MGYCVSRRADRVTQANPVGAIEMKEVENTARPQRRTRGPSATKSNLVYSDLRNKIISGDLAPGERLVIKRIAEEYGVSDIPVREALRLLDKDNLIRYMPYGSAFVREVTDGEIYEVFFIRGMLEGAATQLSVNFVTEMTIRKLSQLCEQMEVCAKGGDYKEYSALNREFHRTIFDTLPFKKLTDQIEELWYSYGWLHLSFRFGTNRMEASNGEHRQILAALRDRSMARAGRAAFDHKQNARKAFIAARHQDGGPTEPESFEGRSSIEGIELLCEIWGESQWPASADPPAQVGESRAADPEGLKE